MRISHGTRIKDINDTNGYGYATVNMINSLRRLGHIVEQNDLEAPVEIWFDQPQHWEWKKNQYKIGYHPWESTKLKDDWVDRMNQCDEIWTPSPIVADWYRADGVKPPVYVYEHGVDKVWTPKQREPEDVIKFLHVGGEAARKRADKTMQAFRNAFPDRTDVSLTMKMISPGWKISNIGRIQILNTKLEELELVNLFHENHVYLYPSYGEGFGLTPLQAISTGMPAVTVSEWAPYAEFLDDDLVIPAKLGGSLWPQIHPGKVWRPDFDAMVDIMRYSVDNYETLHARALARVPEIQKKYDWDSLTKDAFDALEKRL